MHPQIMGKSSTKFMNEPLLSNATLAINGQFLLEMLRKIGAGSAKKKKKISYGKNLRKSIGDSRYNKKKNKRNFLSKLEEELKAVSKAVQPQNPRPTRASPQLFSTSNRSKEKF